jgi:flavin reductase (DIM6/NTAB) family NADH-FMN oxidoreductase RutF
MAGAGGAAGLTVNSFVSVSLAPRWVLCSLARSVRRIREHRG